MAPLRHSPRSSLLSQILTSCGLGVVIFFLILLVINLGISIFYSGRIFPGISMNEIPLAGLSLTEATKRISNSYDYPVSGTILLANGTENWPIKPIQLGVYLDAPSSAKAAFEAGRSGSWFNILQMRFSIFKEGLNLPPTFIFDQKTAVAFLNNLAATINQPVREARISLSGTDVIVENGQSGRVLDIQSSLNALTEQIQTMRDGVVPLVILQSDPVISDVNLQAEFARNILSQPLSLQLPTDGTEQSISVQMEPVDLASFLVFERVSNDTVSEYQIAINRPLMTAYLSSIEGTLDQEPNNSRFIFNDETQQLELIQPATIGRKLDIENSIIQINQALQKREHSAELSFTFNNPQITDEVKGSELGITELVYSYSSYFRGSSVERIQNIKTAAARFHGLLIAPGATLSMSNELGDISLSNGYSEALIILGDQTIKGVGGGVCQVSTTLFRTAFYAGFPILERHPHAYRVGYYEQTATGHNQDLAGMDATVFVPLVDFKFKNDTPYWLLMETYISNANYSLTWKFYSTKDGRVVDYSSTGPENITQSPDPVYRENPDLPEGTKKQVDYAVEGADITVNRSVTKAGTLLFQEQYFTQYEPWGDVWEYGPGTEIPTPTPSP
ncbi:MAG: VanW family protein [Chloroflexi bacterium]|nr:VanW family protein [Chloroflexota bacterium]